MNEVDFDNLICQALEHRGNAFIYKKYFYYLTDYYYAFPGYWKKDAGHLIRKMKKDTEKKQYLSGLPSGVSVFSEHWITKQDDRKRIDPKKYSKTTVHEDNVLTLSVSKQLSQKLYYDHFSKIAYPFRDHLLNTQRDVLNKIHEWRISESVYPLIVSQDYVANDTTTHEKKLSFLVLGMKELPGIAYCYGLALALTEVAGWNVDDFIFTINNQHVVKRIEIRAKTKPIALNNW